MILLLHKLYFQNVNKICLKNKNMKKDFRFFESDTEKSGNYEIFQFLCSDDVSHSYNNSRFLRQS